MTPEGKAAHVYRSYNAAENARDAEAMAALLAHDLQVTLNGRPALSSAADDAAAMAALYDAYPDYRREVIAIVDGGPVAAIRWRMAGTATGRYRALPDLDVHGCSVVEVTDGRIVRAWLYAPDGPIEAVLALAGTDAGG
jgi:predicted ester cyclase